MNRHSRPLFRSTPFFVLFFLAASASPARAHRGHSHGTEAETAAVRQISRESESKTAEMAAAIQAINTDFQAHVKPLAERSCFDCHSDSTRLPWYHAIPGVGWLIDRDIAKGKRHINFSPGFPFGGHGTPQENLKAIAEEVEEGEMPPLLYRLVHREAALSEAEKQAVKSWVLRSQEALARLGMPVPTSEK